MVTVANALKVFNKQIFVSISAQSLFSQKLEQGEKKASGFSGVMKSIPKAIQLGSQALQTFNVLLNYMPQETAARFRNDWEQVKRVFAEGLYPAVARFVETFSQNLPQISALAYTLGQGLGIVFTVLSGLLNIAGYIAQIFIDNWSFIGPIVWGIVAALAAFLILTKGMAIITTIGTMVSTAFEKIGKAAAGVNAALRASPITMIIIAFIALIAIVFAVVGAINHFAGTTYDALGIILGALFVVAAIFYNIWVGIVDFLLGVLETMINYFLGFCNFLANVFKNPISSIIKLFHTMADSVLSIIEKIAGAIDTVLNTNLASAVQGWRQGLNELTANAIKLLAPEEEYEEIFAKVKLESGLDRIEYGDAVDKAHDVSANLKNTLGGLKDNVFGGNNGFDFGELQDGVTNTAGNTAQMANTMSAMEVDVEYMRGIDERKAISRFTTAEITVAQTFNNDIASDTNIDGIMEKWTSAFADTLIVAAEGVHI